MGRALCAEASLPVSVDGSSVSVAGGFPVGTYREARLGPEAASRPTGLPGDGVIFEAALCFHEYRPQADIFE